MTDAEKFQKLSEWATKYEIQIVWLYTRDHKDMLLLGVGQIVQASGETLGECVERVDESMNYHAMIGEKNEKGI